jgi:hypothetical protein
MTLPGERVSERVNAVKCSRESSNPVCGKSGGVGFGEGVAPKIFTPYPEITFGFSSVLFYTLGKLGIKPCRKNGNPANKPQISGFSVPE